MHVLSDQAMQAMARLQATAEAARQTLFAVELALRAVACGDIFQQTGTIIPPDVAVSLTARGIITLTKDQKPWPSPPVEGEPGDNDGRNNGDPAGAH